MDGHRTPRPVDPFDLIAPVSLAREALKHGDGHRAMEALRLMLRHLDAIAADAGRSPFAFDRELIAEALMYPERYRSDVIAMQAALLRGTLGADTPMSRPALKPRCLPDDGA